MAGVRLTDTQRQILLALSRPCAGESRYATPATNQQIASEVFLSVDAVKAHLRVLYRKFGIEELPHNQKRARLVELVLEGGLVSADEEPAASPPPAARGGRKPPRRAIAAALAGLGGLAAVLALAGVFSGDSEEGTSGQALSEGEYRVAVDGYCRLALAGSEPGPRATTAERAGSYLRVIETVGGRLDRLGPPREANLSLQRFRDGLQRAADFTSRVAGSPPGSGANPKLIAQLTIAAGQIQAGALGYRLGPDCLAIGDLVARSARNAAGPP
jgi:hypothetical protein